MSHIINKFSDTRSVEADELLYEWNHDMTKTGTTGLVCTCIWWHGMINETLTLSVDNYWTLTDECDNAHR